MVQRPVSSAWQRAVCPLHEGVTRTVERGVAHPQSFTLACCCSIMLSATSAGSFTLAPKVVAAQSKRRDKMVFRFIRLKVCRQKYTFFAHLLPPAGKNKRFHTRIGDIPSPPPCPVGHAPPSYPRPGLSVLFPVHRAEGRPKEYRMGYEWGTNGVGRGGVRIRAEGRRARQSRHRGRHKDLLL